MLMANVMVQGKSLLPCGGIKDPSFSQESYPSKILVYRTDFIFVQRVGWEKSYSRKISLAGKTFPVNLTINILRVRAECCYFYCY